MLKKIESEIKAAMITKDPAKRDVLRAVKSSANLMAKEKHEEVSDEYILAAIKKEIKALQGTITALEGKSGVEKVVSDANYRIQILNTYMPTMLSKDEVRQIAMPIINALENPNFGLAMKSVMPFLKGKADGKVINEVVKELLMP